MTFRVGQKVVCVNDDFAWKSNFTYPTAGRVYHVRDIELSSNGDICIRLSEIRNRPDGICAITGDQCEPRFLASRFRPIVERKTDISTFTKMLTPQGVDA